MLSKVFYLSVALMLNFTKSHAMLDPTMVAIITSSSQLQQLKKALSELLNSTAPNMLFQINSDDLSCAEMAIVHPCLRQDKACNIARIVLPDNFVFTVLLSHGEGEELSLESVNRIRQAFEEKMCSQNTFKQAIEETYCPKNCEWEIIASEDFQDTVRVRIFCY